MTTTQNISLKWFPGFLAVGLVCVSSGCSKTEDAADSTESVAKILPVVDAATPSGLQVSESASARAARALRSLRGRGGVMAAGDDTAVKEGIEYLFNTTYTNISGDSVVGFFRSAISVIDKRASSEGAGMVTAFKTSCQSGADYTPAITGLPTSVNLTLNPACYKIFAQTAGEQSATGSGYSYGESVGADGAKTVTSWVTLVQSNSTDKFAMLGKITKADAATDAEKGAEVMFLEAGPSGGSWNRYTLYRISANPATQKYEFAIASTAPGVMQAPTSTSDVTGFGCGTRMTSNGTYIRAAGKQLLSGTDCAASGVAFDVCLKADDLSVVADGLCADMAFGFGEIDQTFISDTTVKAEIAAAMMVSAATSATLVSQ